MSDNPAASAHLAALDENGVPRGYAQFIASTLLPRDFDIGPDGTPSLPGVRERMRQHWVTMFPESTWMHKPPDAPDLLGYGDTRETRVVADLVAQGRKFEYRTLVDGTPDGGPSGWYLLEDNPSMPPDVNHEVLGRH